MMRSALLLLSLVFVSLSSPLLADGIVIDKIYHPYVQPLEQELEIRLLQQNNQSGIADNTRLYRLAYGRSLSDRLFIEAYLVGQGSSSESLDLQSIEMEIKWQLTEQGEYWADWGVLAELSKGIGNNIYEASIGLIAEKEFGHWSGTTNFIIEQEWGSGIDDELESVFSLQTRYRYSQTLEPGIEFYAGQNSIGVGPVLMGQAKLVGPKKLKWEAGVIFGLDSKSPDTSVRLLFEYEF
jgi:hypothetical protein|tara:strand:+ start:4257 stop:4970 length:714 start_codon:yes stop_codon:yes gene_type:complete